uniref:Uncharacterized protein n=1 Tax=Micrurus lemniscatus lemniscatus TaxID=129467 RepID=A0A2D4J812_MICLE
MQVIIFESLAAIQYTNKMQQFAIMVQYYFFLCVLNTCREILHNELVSSALITIKSSIYPMLINTNAVSCHPHHEISNSVVIIRLMLVTNYRTFKRELNFSSWNNLQEFG